MELKQAAIQLYPASVTLFYPPAEKQWDMFSNQLYSREWYHTEMAAQPESTVYETLFDFFFKLDFFYFKQKSVNQKSKKILFQKHLNAMYLN